jgi:signal peptidase I
MTPHSTRDGRGRLGRRLSGLAVAVGCVLFLGGFGWAAVVYRPYAVPSGSMSPTVAAGERVLAELIGPDEVRRGDIVVFRRAEWGDLPMVKRVVGVGGDTVECCGTAGLLTVNGREIEEPYLRGSGTGGAAAASASPLTFTARVPAGHLFLLGDERLHSQDSRTRIDDPARGSVPVSAVEARVDAIAWPPGRGVIERPRAFAALPGGVSRPGPVRLMAGAVAAGAVLIVAGCAHGPVTRRLTARARGGDGTRSTP